MLYPFFRNQIIIGMAIDLQIELMTVLFIWVDHTNGIVLANILLRYAGQRTLLFG